MRRSINDAHRDDIGHVCHDAEVSAQSLERRDAFRVAHTLRLPNWNAQLVCSLCQRLRATPAVRCREHSCDVMAAVRREPFQHCLAEGRLPYQREPHRRDSACVVMW